MNIRLTLVSPQYKEKIMNYRNEFIKNGDSLDGTASLGEITIFENWFTELQCNSSEETVRPGLVPATTFLAIDNNDNIVGMIDIRHRLNDYLLEFGGHIGYSVAKENRRKGIATRMLALALLECNNLYINKVLITCDKQNIASAKTIINNKGVLENEICDGDRITQRYWIHLVL